MNRHFIRSLTIILILITITVLPPPGSVVHAATNFIADDIKYSIKSDTVLDFDEEDFYDECRSLTGQKLSYILFTALPNNSEGVLCYDYSNKKALSEQTKIATDTRYRYGSSTPYLSEVSFIPNGSFRDTLTVKYTGYDTDGNSFTGKLKISVNEPDTNIITYKIGGDEDYVTFDKSDFADICKSIQGKSLDYVKFTLPDSDDGVLYYDFDEDMKISTQTTVTDSKKYYYDNTPRLSKVTFVKGKSFSGPLTIKYTGYDTSGNSYSSKIRITEDSTAGVGTTSAAKLVNYGVNSSKDTVTFDEDDFNKVCYDIAARDLDYITLTIPSASKGVLFYNYSDGQYGAPVTSNKKYYRNLSPYIANITFVPNTSFSGICYIEYTGYDNKGLKHSGNIAISNRASAPPTIGAINYSGKINSVIQFKDEDFNSICRSITGTTLNYVRFSLPDAALGGLYYGYTSSGDYTSKVKSGTSYYYSGQPYLLNTFFVPTSGTSGTIPIEYTGFDANGLSFTGKINIQLGNASISTGSAVLPQLTSQVTTQASTTQASTTQTTAPQAGTSQAIISSFPATAQAISTSSSAIPPTSVTTSSAATQAGIVYVKSKYFHDVDISYSWAVPAIDGLYESGVISGTKSGSLRFFYPDAKFSRGDFILILQKALNLKTTSKTTPFSDVPSGSYYYSAIMTAKALGIAQGAYDKFNPTDPITRETAMLFIQRAINITGKTIPPGDVSSLSSYMDGDQVSVYARSAVAALIKAGVITGDEDRKIHPNDQLTRVQTAMIISRAKNLK